MANTKDIQRRIKSVRNIKKITKAMEMVAAAKMRRAIEAVLETRTYANLSWETILRLSTMENNGESNLHPLLQKREKSERVAIILMTSNRGLCGGFNSNLLNKTLESIKKHPDPVHEFILMGKKGRKIQKFGFDVSAEFEKADLVSGIADINPLATLVTEEFLSGKYDKVMLAYNDFVNAAKQVPRVKQLLPVDIYAEDEYLGAVGKSPRIETKKEYIEEKKTKHAPSTAYDYMFEPSPAAVLDKMVPQLIKVQLYQALLESNASEHSARMTAMHQANEAAGDIVDDLTLSYNKARQAGITAEIAEISAGANALAEDE